MKFASTATLLLSTTFGFVAADGDAGHKNLRALKEKAPKEPEVVSPKIYGGQMASPGEYPYFASFPGCGGTLIAPDMALTAAHCGDYTGASILIGAYEYQEETFGAVYRTCSDYAVHPNYIATSGLINDWAICKLSAPVVIDESQVKLELNTNASPSYTNGEELKAMGFGRLGTSFFDFRVPDTLMETTLEGRQCSSGISQQICAGGPGGQNGVTDVCQGDSGGPLVKVETQPDGTEVHKHVGLVSSGALCPIAATGTYARTAAGYDWIIETVCTLGTISEDIDCSNFSAAPTSAPTTFDCNTGEVLTVTVETDRYASESSWILEKLDDSEQEWSEVASNPLPQNLNLYEDQICLDDDSTYRFTLFDTYGDGLCYQGVCGSYSVDLNGDEILSDGPFGSDVGVTFVTGSCEDASGDLKVRYQGTNYQRTCSEITAFLASKPPNFTDQACAAGVVGTEVIVSDLCRSLCASVGPCAV